MKGVVQKTVVFGVVGGVGVVGVGVVGVVGGGVLSVLFFVPPPLFLHERELASERVMMTEDSKS